MNFIEAIHQAQKEAFKHGIMANAIFINKNFILTKHCVFSIFEKMYLVKPMILGLKADITDELPEECAFAVLEVDKDKLMTEHEKQIRKDTAKEILRDVYKLSITLSKIHPLDVKELAEKYGVEVDDE